MAGRVVRRAAGVGAMGWLREGRAKSALPTFSGRQGRAPQGARGADRAIQNCPPLRGSARLLVPHSPYMASRYFREPKGNAVASNEQLARFAKVPKREFMRRGINQHTLEKICRREPMRAVKLEKCLNALVEYERGSCVGLSKPWSFCSSGGYLLADA